MAGIKFAAKMRKKILFSKKHAQHNLIKILLINNQPYLISIDRKPDLPYKNAQLCLYFLLVVGCVNFFKIFALNNHPFKI